MASEEYWLSAGVIAILLLVLWAAFSMKPHSPETRRPSDLDEGPPPGADAAALAAHLREIRSSNASRLPFGPMIAVHEATVDAAIAALETKR